MCGAHVIMNVDKKLQLLKDTKKQERIREDITNLQLSVNEESFELCQELFLKKWTDDHEVQEFLSHFKKM